MYMRTFHVYCPIWVKFDVRDMQIMFLSIYEFLKNRRREGHTFLMFSIV
jgi:hypothetical protein